MSKKCSDQFYYAVRIGRKPGIYRGWYGEYGAKTQITGIRNYDYSTGYLKTSSWEDADAYMRTHELFVVESDFTIKKATSFKEDMSVVYGEARVAAKETPAQPPTAPATENAFFSPSAPSVPYHRDEKLESFLHAYYPDRRFTDDQKAAIQALSGAHLLYAIPGSGKTAVLTARAGWMIHCGIPAENILIMTFGKKAAEHMADVFRERFPSFSVPFFCTIHSFCYRIIRQAEAEGLIKKYSLIVDEEDDPVPEAMDGETANAWIVDESPDEVPSGRTKESQPMKTRIITAIVGILVLIGVMFTFNTMVFNLVIAAITLIAIHEIYSALGFEKKDWLMYAVLVPYTLLVMLSSYSAMRKLVMPMSFVLVTFFAIYLVVRNGTISYQKASGLLVFSGIVIFCFYSFVLLKERLPVEKFGYDAVFFILLILCFAWGGDTCAYFAGRAFGKHKLCPVVSPKKTVEGAIGGVLGTMVFGVIATVIYSIAANRMEAFTRSNIGVSMYVIIALLGCIAAVLGIYGDLFASVVKRQCGIKDYGTIFPGHGGILDRFDSVMFIAPFVTMVVIAVFYH